MNKTLKDLSERGREHYMAELTEALHNNHICFEAGQEIIDLYELSKEENSNDTDLLEMLSKGEYHEIIAYKLGVKHAELSRSIVRLIKKYDCKNLYQLIYYATKNGLIK